MNFHRVLTPRNVQLVLAVPMACALTVTSCASKDTGSKAAPTPTADGSAEAPTVFGDKGGEPCGINSGYPGDNVCIKAPAPTAGFQFHYGPSSYTDTNEVQKFLLQPGDEVTDCVFFPTPNTTDVYYNEYHSRMRPGSHHMLLYIQPISGSGPINAGPQDCNQGAQTRNLFGAQTAVTDVTGTLSPGVENDGLAVRIPANQQAVMQMHFINATNNPILREGWANIVFVDKSQVKQVGDPIFFIAGYGMNIPMGQSQTITGTAKVPSDATSDFRLIIGTGHYHTHTSTFTAWATTGGQKQMIIREYATPGVPPEPANWYFSSGKTNPMYDMTSNISGAISGVLHLQPGDSITWACDITNNDQPNGLQFGNWVYKAEMCNMFGMYAPSDGKVWQGLNP